MVDQCPSSSHISGPPESPWNRTRPKWTRSFVVTTVSQLNGRWVNGGQTFQVLWIPVWVQVNTYLTAVNSSFRVSSTQHAGGDVVLWQPALALILRHQGNLGLLENVREISCEKGRYFIPQVRQDVCVFESFPLPHRYRRVPTRRWNISFPLCSFVLLVANTQAGCNLKKKKSWYHNPLWFFFFPQQTAN